MRISTEQYAELCSDVYNDIRVGIRPQGQEDAVTLAGVKYKILEHANNPKTGYQGTIYQRVDTGEIVVAHRGTEPPGKDFKDALTDKDMLMACTNPQAEDAVQLTQHALDTAQKLASRGPAPVVTVTGHSLGGTLAQITAHRFNLQGETFNAYGAASLHMGIPVGGSNVINHVVAGDGVSAASPHFGQLRIYATPQDVATMAAAGYHAGAEQPLTLAKVLALTKADHGIANFLGHDDRGLPKQSILHPHAERLADENATLIDNYRRDVAAQRIHIASEPAKVGQPAPMLADRLDAMHHPVQSAPAHRQGHTNRFMHAVQPPSLNRRQISHNAEGLGQQALSETDRLLQHGDASLTRLHGQVMRDVPGLTDDEAARLAAGLTLRAYKSRIEMANCDEVQCAQYNGKNWARIVDSQQGNPFTNFALVDKDQAMQIPVQDTLAQLHTLHMAQAQGLAHSQNQGHAVPVIA